MTLSIYIERAHNKRKGKREVGCKRGKLKNVSSA
jgi:hypothetical protein